MKGMKSPYHHEDAHESFTILASTQAFPPCPYVLTFWTTFFVATNCSFFFFVLCFSRYATSIYHWFPSTPIKHVDCPIDFAYFLFIQACSNFISRCTQSLKPRALNLEQTYSNSLFNWLHSSTMLVGFCSPTFTTAMFKICGTRPLIATSHSFLPSQAPSISPCFVTSIV